ncbi:hypothetical protein VFPBJ_02847 [Purpureocillium lilacinum]|uniref:Uncharacterized protein n=1 Tax=Purpureocillium lilacinum TaxID=33203 RepID=A0A179H3Z4_PURLI|nr:hypothetical protein VFPBJ_02847 [Purpureocillium lilacinum]
MGVPLSRRGDNEMPSAVGPITPPHLPHRPAAGPLSGSRCNGCGRRWAASSTGDDVLARRCGRGTESRTNDCHRPSRYRFGGHARTHQVRRPCLLYMEHETTGACPATIMINKWRFERNACVRSFRRPRRPVLDPPSTPITDGMAVALASALAWRAQKWRRQICLLLLLNVVVAAPAIGRPWAGPASPHLLSQLAGGGRTWRARATGWYWWRPSMQSWCRRRRRPRRRPLLFVGLGWGEGKKGFAVCSGLSVMHALHDACTNARTCNHFFPLVSSHPFDNFFATPSLLGDSSSASMLPRAGLARDGKRHGLAGHGDPMGLGQRGLGWHGCRRCCWKVGGGGGSEPKQNGPGF